MLFPPRDADQLVQFYVFNNIPFAAPPVGDLRWREPELPSANSSLIDGSYGPSCVQTGIGSPDNIEGISGPESEDCLYLDVYVPGDAFRSNNTKLPVIHWFYGVSNQHLWQATSSHEQRAATSSAAKTSTPAST